MNDFDRFVAYQIYRSATRGRPSGYGSGGGCTGCLGMLLLLVVLVVIGFVLGR